MKVALLVFLAWSGLACADDQPYQPECLDQAKAAVTSTASVPSAAVTFYDAALVGDGVDAAETIVFQVKGINGLYIVTMEYDDCSVFASPKLLNN